MSSLAQRFLSGAFDEHHTLYYIQMARLLRVIEIMVLTRIAEGLHRCLRRYDGSDFGYQLWVLKLDSCSFGS